MYNFEEDTEIRVYFDQVAPSKPQQGDRVGSVFLLSVICKCTLYFNLHTGCINQFIRQELCF